VFPVWLRFHGGKGVATAAGVLIAFDWRLGLSVLGVWLAVAAATRYSSLAALVAAVAAPALAAWMLGVDARFYAVLAMAALLILRHRVNLAKLVRGEESRIGEKKKAAQPSP
jgi:glycerol-3-phosphate acyltransferase PlsY